MMDSEMFQKELQMLYLDTCLRIKKLEQTVLHSPGIIIWKGAKKQYPYWQFCQEGKQIQQAIPKNEVNQMKEKIEIMKHQKKTLRELILFRKEIQQMLRIFHKSTEEILKEEEQKELDQVSQQIAYQKAKQIAAHKWHQENYKHITDRGEFVASKSEVLIANILFARGISYEYEKMLVIEDKKVFPDFFLHSRTGEEMIWEHAGLLDNREYAERFEEKLKLYEKAGYVRAKNLIITQDENGVFSAEKARRMIELYHIM